MMSRFLANNHDELVERCKAKVALRPRRAATAEQLSNGVPLFLAQLQKTLEAEEGAGDAAESLRISGESGGGTLVVSEMGVSATAHGKQLLNLGFSVDQVVHDYGDLCQAITDLAFERDAPFSIDEFRTLNRCLDNAIASAVSAFSHQRDAMVARKQTAEVNERVGVLVHELRNSLSTASYAVAALEQGNLPISGSTGAVLKRSLAALNTLVNRSLAEVHTEADAIRERQTFPLTSFIAEARNDALLYAQASGCRFTTAAVDPALELTGDHARLLSALESLLQNAFKFSRPDTEVTLNSQAVGDKILISVHDHCGGLAPGYATTMFKPFSQRTVGDKSSLGLGLSIARASVEADGGTLTVQDVPAVGCVFTISLPRYN
ncbi:sensor histidine kinase [Caenimonas soli]|uniref:sensor histidine kinase n=1 Tax=Caenimonas soli TaxID=2735555 RepID=UPI002E27DEFE|nr:HAMP domain-containing sensor histidine kinase [Caenimonas soli]